MMRFAELYNALDSTTKTNEKIAAMSAYFGQVDGLDSSWAIHFLSGSKLRRLVPTKLLRTWAAEEAGIPDWLFEESYHAVGDLAETLTLTVPPGRISDDKSLDFWISQRLMPLRKMDETEQRSAILDIWRQTPTHLRFVVMKLVTGAFRVGVSKRLVTRAVADQFNVAADVIAHRLMGDWKPSHEFFQRLIDADTHDTVISQPYPFCLAHAIDNEAGPEPLGDPSSYVAEWKWDGIRGQVIRRQGETFVWSRGEELMENRWPELESLIPDKMDRFPWSGHIGTRMIPQVVSLLESVNSALVFANTRSQTEIWYQHLLKHKPEWAGQIAIHHGSLDMTVRRWVEDGLREGRLRGVVCTSSLDLGVDFTAVDLVIQIGSPKGAARLLQRAGRSGHQPGAQSRLAFVPTNAIELIELAAAHDSIRSGRLEARPMLDKPLDVLAQHVVTIAIGGGFDSDELLDEVRTAHAYRSLTDAQWQWVLDFVVQGGQSLAAYPDYHRVEVTDGRYQVTAKRTITNHRLNIGTIVADASMHVKFLKGKTLGTAEESFVSKLSPGEKFLFAGRLVELVRVQDNAAYVRRATGKPDAVPRWMGGRMPLSSELSEALRRKFEEASEGNLLGREMKALRPIFELQSKWSTLPRGDELLIEKVKTRAGYHVFLFPFEGRLVHEGLSALFAYRMSKMRKQSFSMACNDHGIVLQSPTAIQVEQAVAAGVFATGDLVSDILESMNSTEMAKRQFRQIARVAGLIHPGLPGRRKSAGHLQASSNLFFDVFCQYDPDNMLLEQSRREVLEQQLESSRMRAALQRIKVSRIIINEPKKVTPLSFGLLIDKLRDRVSSETLADRVRRMLEDLERAAETGK